jgi:exonuclease III
MIKILSWNIHTNKKGMTPLLKNVLADVVNENEIDIVILQEAFGIEVSTSLNSLINQYDEVVAPGNIIENGVRIFLRQNTFKFTFLERHSRNKLVLLNLKKISGIEEFNIAAVHLYSKVGNTERQQLWKNLPIIQKIKNFEDKVSNNNKTILVGDLNHNPYESNMLDPNFLNCKDSKTLIDTLIKKPVSKKTDNDYWYNPMWNLLGDYNFIDGNERITGTFFRYTIDEKPIWNLFDGFIIRHSIMNSVDYKKSKIITHTKTINFLKPFTIGKDDSMIKEQISDHLPIMFTFLIN